MALAALAPLAVASGGDEFDTVRVPAAQGVNVSAEAGKGVTFDAGDEFKATLKSYLQAQYFFAARDSGNADLSSVRIRTARLILAGHVFDPVTRFALSLEGVDDGSQAVNNNGAVKDAWLMRRLYTHDDWTLDVRAGQQKTLYGRETTGTLSQQMFGDYSLAGRTFSGKRARGANVLFSAMDQKLRASAGIFNTSPQSGGGFAVEEGSNGDNELNYLFGVRYDHKGDMGDMNFAQGDLGRSDDWNVGVGANVYIGNERAAATDVEVIGFNVNAVVKRKGLSGMFEFYSSSNELDNGTPSVDSNGFNLQGTYMLENDIAVGARFSLAAKDDPDPNGIGITPVSKGSAANGTALAGDGQGDVQEITLMAGKFFNGHSNKVLAEVTFQSVEPDQVGAVDDDNIIFKVSYAVIF
ncbi:MAG: hypothetical protein ACE5F1_07910 [Planctomycetota bacterium]